ncbi:unnamed protein product, partial [Echinostoma caproni]|uniref:Btz domain-containing protein n=1 Tax=Echinostoma caproni TaxID=27848 RepID=A0A183BG47_9TREM
MFHGPRPMFHGNQEAFDVLHTHEHRSDHGPDGERMLMENKRMIGREMKYRPGDQYTKDTGNGRWKMFGHEVQKAHKDHSKLYVIPERPFRLHVGDGDHYGIPTSHHTDYESYKQGDWLKTGGWHDGDAGDHYRAAGHGAFPYERNYRRGKPTMAYREPQIRYHNAYDSGEWRPFYEKQKYKNHIHRNRSPTIGKRRGKGQSYQS